MERLGTMFRLTKAALWLGLLIVASQPIVADARERNGHKSGDTISNGDAASPLDDALGKPDVTPPELIAGLMDRADLAAKRQDYDQALGDLALAMVLGAKIDGQFEALLANVEASGFVVNVERAWRVLHPMVNEIAQSSATVPEEVEVEVEVEPTAPLPVERARLAAVQGEINKQDDFETINSAGLLAAPRFSGASIATLPPGTRLTKNARYGMWAQVTLEDGLVGYIALRNLRKAGAEAVDLVPEAIVTEPIEPEPVVPETAEPEAVVTEPAVTEPENEHIVPVPRPVFSVDTAERSTQPKLELAVVEVDQQASGDELASEPSTPARIDVEQVAGIVLSSSKDIWIRQSPNADAETIGVLRAGAQVRQVAEVGSWTQIETPEGAMGYVGARWLTSNTTISATN